MPSTTSPHAEERSGAAGARLEARSALMQLSSIQRIVSDGGARFERRDGGPPHWNEATQLSCIWRSVTGPHSWAMRLARNDGLVHKRRSYCSLSRTFWSALSERGAANAGPAAINATARQLQNSLGIVPLPCVVAQTEYATARVWQKCGGSPNHCQPAAD